MKREMSNIKLIVSEVDGILTDGFSSIDELGNTLFKNFFTSEFEAVNKLKKFCPVVFMSNDNAISYNMCRRKNLPFFWAKRDKRSTLLQILRKYNVTAEDVLYIGSKLSDTKCINMIPKSVSTIDGLGVLHIDSPYVLTKLYRAYFK